MHSGIKWALELMITLDKLIKLSAGTKIRILKSLINRKNRANNKKIGIIYIKMIIQSVDQLAKLNPVIVIKNLKVGETKLLHNWQQQPQIHKNSILMYE